METGCPANVLCAIEQEIHWSRAKQLRLWKNYKFFQKATIKKRKNTIWKIKDTQGIWLEDQDRISQVITKEFQKRCKVDDTVNPIQEISLSRDITEAESEFLTKDVINEEILEAAKQMNPLRAPGPDGMQAIFYQKTWGIVESMCVIWYGRLIQSIC